MPLSPIKRNVYRDPDQAAVQDRAIASVLADPEQHLAAYCADPRSFDGRYVAADLFKETFEDFRAIRVGGHAQTGPLYDTASRLRRSRYNSPIHNAAAVLSAEQFRRACAQASPSQPAVFLTGSPGAGKTTFVLNQHDGALRLPTEFGVVFEGQLARPASGIEKMEIAIRAGLRPLIIAVHARPENALDNTLDRFMAQGRGASIHLMSQIVAELPGGLAKIRDHFAAMGVDIALEIHDNRNYPRPRQYSGWDHLSVLHSEGSYQELLERHEAHLHHRWNAGTLDADAYRQAAGREPPQRGRVARLAGGAPSAEQQDGDRSGAPSEGRPAQLLDSARLQRSLAAAEAVGRRIGGDQAVTTAAIDGHAYQGPIVGETDLHVVQGGSTLRQFIAHSRDRLAPAPAVGEVVDVRYPPDHGQPAQVVPLTMARAADKTAEGRDDGEAMER